MWLEDFFAFCDEDLEGDSRAMMVDLLNFEADFKTLQVIYNSIGNNDFSNAIRIVTMRKQLCPSVGYLYPDVQRNIFSADNLDVLLEKIKGVEDYFDLVKAAPDLSKKEQFSFDKPSLDDLMYAAEAKKYALAFEGQSHYAAFYAYVKLKEQEIRNLV